MRQLAYNTLKCLNCRSVTPLGEYCRWCSKPIGTYKPREPTDAERTRYKQGHRDKPAMYVRKNGAAHPVRDNKDVVALETELREFSRTHGVAITRFLRDRGFGVSFFKKMQEGRIPKPETIAKVRQAMVDYKK